MKASSILLISSATVAAAYSPFVIPTLTTHQPIGSGSTNFYYINFEITSDNSGEASYAYCQESWGDNGWTRPEPYSVNVPSGQWINCDTEEGAYDGASAFQFQLHPYFSIGNFSLSVKQELGSGTRQVDCRRVLSYRTLRLTLRSSPSITGFRRVDNGTNRYTCDINPTEVFPSQHASGDCSIPAQAEPFRISISQAAA